MGTRIDLNGTWKLRWYDSTRGDKVDRLSDPAADLGRAWDAPVPGDVHRTLIGLGILPEPTLGLNHLQGRWVEETFWHYRREFSMPKLAAGERASLVFESLHLGAQVHLNGKPVGQHANAFYPCRLDITDALRTDGLNVLIVTVESGLFHAAEKPTKDLESYFDSRLTKRPWLRTAQNSHSWDWAPRLLNVGILGNVYVEINRDVRWDGASVQASLDAGLRRGQVTVRAFVEGLGAATAGSTGISGRLIARIEETGQETAVEAELRPGENAVEALLAVDSPRLWWPVGHGEQALYTVTARFEVGGQTIGQATRRVGFRHVRVNQDPHPTVGRYFIFEINGKPIFCKGGNSVPADILLGRIDRDRYLGLVDRALEANCNFLRIWGGGLYESNDFYELCDSKGILVWQEFIFACNRYPGTDETFYYDIKREATHQIRRLSHHASMIAWCGNNEMEWASVAWPGWDKGAIRPDHAIFHQLLPSLLRKEDPSRYYQPSSPYSPDGQFPNGDESGDQHPWSVGFAEGDFRKYRDMICRFPNEGGILGPNALPTVQACLPEGMKHPGSFAWEQHDNSVSYWGLGKPAPDQMLKLWTGRDVEGMTIEDYVYWAGVVQGMGLAEYIRNFRRRMFDSSAAIFWMYNDCWPTVRSWTIVDYYLRRTPSFGPVRRAFAPVAVAVVREGDRVCIYGINEGPELHAQVRFGLLALAGSYPLDQTEPATLKANSSTLLATFDGGQWDALGQKTHVAFALLMRDGVEVARDTLILPVYHEMQWPKTNIRCQVKGETATFESDTFAWRVCLDLDGERPLADNFFDVYPGVPTVLPWPKMLGEPRILRVGNLLT
jgi:beta-mannosidase